MKTLIFVVLESDFNNDFIFVILHSFELFTNEYSHTVHINEISRDMIDKLKINLYQSFIITMPKYKHLSDICNHMN